MTCGFLIQLVFCKKKKKKKMGKTKRKTMWFSGAPPPNKNPGSAPEQDTKVK